MGSFWHQSLVCYYDNPIPGQFKERLFAQLARYCAAPYSVVTHSCSLHGLGVPAEEVFRILDHCSPSIEEDLQRTLVTIGGASRPLPGWPEQDPELEDAIACVCILLYVKSAEAGPCREELQHLLDPKTLAHLLGFLAYVRMFHFWMEAHPEITYHSDPQVRAHILSLLQEEPQTGRFLPELLPRIRRRSRPSGGRRSAARE